MFTINEKLFKTIYSIENQEETENKKNENCPFADDDEEIDLNKIDVILNVSSSDEEILINEMKEIENKEKKVDPAFFINSFNVSGLIKAYLQYWNEKEATFEPIPFNATVFRKLLQTYIEAFPCEYDPSKEFGAIECEKLPGEWKIVAQADRHGYLPDLIKDLEEAQKNGLFDYDYNTTNKVHFIFFGDYVDRGENSLEVLTLLLMLKLHYKNQVTLLRGNHECVRMNLNNSNFDINFQKFLQYDENTILLNNFYMTLPLAKFFCQVKEDYDVEKSYNEQLNYVVFTHGALEFYPDYYPFLSKKELISRMIIPKKIQLCDRLKNIKIDNEADYSTLIDNEKDEKKRRELIFLQSARNIKAIIMGDLRINKEDSKEIEDAYGWGDFKNETNCSVVDLGSRRWWINAAALYSLFTFFSIYNIKISFLFKGHGHLFEQYEFSEKIIATTLPVSTLYKSLLQPNMFLVLTTNMNAKEWTKTAFIRSNGSTITVKGDAVKLHEKIKLPDEKSELSKWEKFYDE